MNVPHGLIGVVHVRPLPGDPLHEGETFEDVVDAAQRDAETLAEGGVNALIVENFGSVPFVKGGAADPSAPHTLATLTVIVHRLRELGLPLGVNVLRNDVVAALGIAAAAGGVFVRVNIHVGAYVTDQGVIEGHAAETLRYRHAIGARRIAICADARVKHATPLAPAPIEEEVDDLVHRGLADALIVTGAATGQPVNERELRQVAERSQVPVWIGSGLTQQNAAALCPIAHGAIVGTAFKRDGDVRQPVDLARVRALADLTRETFRARSH